MRRMRWVIEVLRQHVLLILGLLALLAMTVVLWSFPTWPLTGLAILQRHLLLIGMLGGGLTILILLWGLPKWQTLGVPDLKDRLTVENAARQTLAQMIGGAVLMAGLFFMWANLKITQETATKSQDLAGELTSVKYAPDSSGRLVVESKDSMKGRNLRSPDVADALVVTFYTPRRRQRWVPIGT